MTMNKKITIIQGHPDPAGNHFCHGLADAYQQSAKAAGHDVRLQEVANIEFPLLRTAADFQECSPPECIQVAQEDIRWADHLVIIYPLWLGAIPALLKAYIEQVFRPGFALDYGNNDWPQGLLKGKSARIIVTMGMPAFAYRWFYGAHSLKSLERNILKFCGIKPVRHTIIGMVDALSEKKAQQWLNKVKQLGAKAR